MALRMEEGLQDKKMQVPLGNWKAKETDSHLELPERMWSFKTLVLEFLILSKIINLCYFTLFVVTTVYPTKFVRAAIGN